MATAQVIFHRFFYVSSMLSFGVNVGVKIANCKRELTQSGPLRLGTVPRNQT